MYDRFRGAIRQLSTFEHSTSRLAVRLVRRWYSRIYARDAFVRSEATYETHGFPPWRFLFRSQPGRQGLALPEKTKHLHARRACLYAFLHSRRWGTAHYPNERPTIGSYRDFGGG